MVQKLDVDVFWGRDASRRRLWTFFLRTRACLWLGVRLTGKIRTGVHTSLCSLPDLLYRPEDEEVVLDRAEPHHSENSRINHGKYLLAILRVQGPVRMGIRGQVP
jgi:hypothetical protein